jgi:cytidine deaminase
MPEHAVSMPHASEDVIDALRRLARTSAVASHAPFSDKGEAAVLLLADGQWIPGVRVESASFSLLIPPLLNAFTTAVAAARRDVLAAVLSRPYSDEDRAFVASVGGRSFAEAAIDVYLRADAPVLPWPSGRVDPFLSDPAPAIAAKGVALARRVAGRAYVPESDFPVGCVLETAGGGLLPGVNVEHNDWTRILCAERNAIGTAVSYGLREMSRLYLTCPRDPSGTPCGACRQLLAELAPGCTIWMDRGEEPAEEATSEALLPGFFSGAAICGDHLM